MKTNILYRVFLFILLLISVYSCTDDPISNQEDHFEAIGTIIYDATGAEVVSILRGITNDTLKVISGKLSDHYTVKFYIDNENIVDSPQNEHTRLNYEIGDSNLVTWWQHPGEEGGFEFHLNGKKKGITTVQLFIVHEDHNDYRSGEIPLLVE
ncbi:MAG: hypothetical protein HYS24_09975 [Ignavibacteriales bacterium]|nr:hypothetical protein [Ignavibacteriales bacterium]